VKRSHHFEGSCYFDKSCVVLKVRVMFKSRYFENVTLRQVHPFLKVHPGFKTSHRLSQKTFAFHFRFRWWDSEIALAEKNSELDKSKRRTVLKVSFFWRGHAIWKGHVILKGHACLKGHVILKRSRYFEGYSAVDRLGELMCSL